MTVRPPRIATTSSGVKSPFFVGCHRAAAAGLRLASELVSEALRLAQHGQPLPPLTLLPSVASHS